MQTGWPILWQPLHPVSPADIRSRWPARLWQNRRRFTTCNKKVQIPLSSLPIVSVLPALFAAIDNHASVILQAPPGAGKSTLLPLELVSQHRLPGRIIMLEPRRLAARNIAAFLARQLGEKVGERIGLRVRGESRTSAATRLEIVTEGC